VVAAYVTGKGYVGIGTVTHYAQPIINFQHLRGKEYVLDSLFANANNLNSEFAISVKWESIKNKDEACWKRNAGLFSTRLIVCSLKNQGDTIKFLRECFSVNLKL
jgi:hypothetical protein